MERMEWRKLLLGSKFSLFFRIETNIHVWVRVPTRFLDLVVQRGLVNHSFERGLWGPLKYISTV